MNYEWNENYLKEQSHMEIEYTYNVFKKNHITPEKNYSILDVGCSNGYNTHLIFREFINSNILGIDIDEEHIIQAVQCNKLRNFTFKNIDITNTNTSTFIEKFGKFDIVYCSYVIQYLANPQSFLNQCYKLLKPNGFIIMKVSDDHGKICYPHSEVLKQIIKTYNEDIVPEADRFCAEKCYQWLRKAGFINIFYEYLVEDTVNTTLQERLSLYYKDFAFRKFGLQQKNDYLILAYNKQLDYLYELFQQEDFYYSSISYIITAQI